MGDNKEINVNDAEKEAIEVTDSEQVPETDKPDEDVDAAAENAAEDKSEEKQDADTGEKQDTDTEDSNVETEDDFGEFDSEETENHDDAQEESENDDDNTEKSKSRFPWKKLLVSSGVIVVLIAAVYLGGCVFYNSHFMFNTLIGGVDCSNLTAEAAKEKIQNEIDNYTFTFYEKNDVQEVITGDEIHLTYSPIEGMEALLDEQETLLWIDVRKVRNLPLNIEVDYDKDTLYNRITEMNFAANSREIIEGSVNNIFYDNGAYYVNDDGTQDVISINEMYEKVKPKIKDLYRGMSMEKENCYGGLENDDMMKGVLNLLNKYVSANVTYTNGEEKTVVDSDKISQWLRVGDDYSVNIETEKVREFIDELAKSYNTYGKERKFTTSKGNVVTVSGGNYGWLVNNKKETEELCNIIRNGETVEREPVYERTAAVHGPDNDIANTYAEISIADQHLWYYKDGNLVVSTDVVTGRTGGRDTPKGTYFVAYKARNTVLTGPGYASPVSFWMPFNGGVGMHDASWRSTFGGTIYQGNGSHGCVNMPYSAAEKVYQSISAGDPVIVY
ncbi:MAG: L,D-transpeptidase family protein [Oscillospiraceae bacterium]|nr:L,D-transpeptidase family protein [Oscillospiraceae bacterium]